MLDRPRAGNRNHRGSLREYPRERHGMRRCPMGARNLLENRLVGEALIGASAERAVREKANAVTLALRQDAGLERLHEQSPELTDTAKAILLELGDETHAQWIAAKHAQVVLHRLDRHDAARFLQLNQSDVRQPD